MFLLALALAAAHADCAGGSTNTLPAPGGLLRGQLVLEATGHFRERYADLDAELVSGDRRVELRVVETLKGSFDLQQWVLVPEVPLEPGRRWVLELDGEPLVQYFDGKHQPATWTSAASDEALAWRGTPQVRSTERAHFGCGPAVSVVVDVPVAGAVAIEATVRRVDGGQEGTARVPVTDGQVVLGHGMCAGAFELDEGVEYFADLVAVDARGKELVADDSPIRFTAP